MKCPRFSCVPLSGCGLGILHVVSILLSLLGSVVVCEFIFTEALFVCLSRRGDELVYHECQIAANECTGPVHKQVFPCRGTMATEC